MAFIVKTAKTLRNHWKKSTFAAIVITYAANSTKNYLDTQELMREYCTKAAKYGSQTIPVNVDPRTITVILNPNANKRNASKDFDKYCAPLLHLAGICVDVVKTENEGHAKQLMESLTSTSEAIVVAGGDGTLSEVITGLLRRTGENTTGLVPIGILPLGKNNSFGNELFPGGKNVKRVRGLAEATMAVIEEVSKPVDVMRIEILSEDKEKSDNNSSIESKPIYALTGLNWGAYRDAETKKDAYWYFGRFRKYVTYIFNGMKNNLTWKCEALVNYSPPCKGCSHCRKKAEDSSPKKWYNRFSKSDDESLKYLSITNPECSRVDEINIKTVDLNLCQNKSREFPKLQILIGPKNVDYIDFVREGFHSENGGTRKVEKLLEARTVEIKPKVDKETWFSIDNEEFEVKPIRVTLLPQIIRMFCKKETVNN